jgi:hypothetical protein
MNCIPVSRGNTFSFIFVWQKGQSLGPRDSFSAIYPIAKGTALTNLDAGEGRIYA